jgi:hypothetical protein
LFFSIWQVRPVIVEPNDPLGLVSHFNFYYWLGLAVIIVTSVCAFLDRSLKKDHIFIVLLLALSLFLIGIGSFIYENARDPIAYYPTAEVTNILSTHHVNINNPLAVTYDSWPALHFISASILTIINAGFNFIKYVPIFWAVLFTIITFAIGKRLKLENRFCFLLSFLSISSFMFFYDYQAASLGIIFYILLLFFLLAPKPRIEESVAAIIVFCALVITHGLTTLVVFPSILIVSIYRRNMNLLFLVFILIFGAWYIYQIPAWVEIGVRNAWTHPILEIFQVGQKVENTNGLTTTRASSRYSQLGYVAIYVTLMITSVFSIFRKNLSESNKKQVITLFCLAIGAALVIFFSYGQGSEELYRAYLFCLVPAAAITVLTFLKGKLATLLLVSLMVVLPVMFLLANYAGDASFGQILTTELKGEQFMALTIKPEQPFFVNGRLSGTLAGFYDPDIMQVGFEAPEWDSQISSNLSELNSFPYVIIGKQGTDMLLMAQKEDPYANWYETGGGMKSELIYNNGYFQIYKNGA